MAFSVRSGESISPRARRLAAAAWSSAAILYLGVEALAAEAFSPSYSYARNYISDLGVPLCGSVYDGRAICSPLHALVNGAFAVQGLLFATAGLIVAYPLAAWRQRIFAAFAVANGIGLLLIGLVPETAGRALHPLHSLGAMLAILGGNAAALASAACLGRLGLPRIQRAASLALPLLAGAALTALLAARGRGSPIVFADGVWERISVYTITTWELLTAACLAARDFAWSCRTPSSTRGFDRSSR